MRLTCPRILSRVKEGKKLFPLRSPCLQTCKHGIQIIFLQQMGLFLICLGGKDEVLRHNGEFIQDEDVRRWRTNVGDSKSIRRLEKWIEGLLSILWLGRLGLLRNGGAISKLKLIQQRRLAEAAWKRSGGPRTGKPFTCKMATWVGQKVSSPAALAALNLSLTRSGRLVGRSIFGAGILSDVVFGYRSRVCCDQLKKHVSPSSDGDQRTSTTIHIIKVPRNHFGRHLGFDYCILLRRVTS